MVTFLLIVALAGVVGTVAFLLTLHLLPTGLSPLRDPVSAYGISRYAGLYRGQTISTAVAAFALAVALPPAGVASAVPAIIALIVLGVARLIISWFPMDAGGTRRTRTGRVHNLLAFGAFAAASVGGFMTGIAFGATPGLEQYATASTILGWIMTVASVVTILGGAVRGIRPVFGLAERLIYVGMLAWLTLTAAALLTL